jgi:hypothetical protein
LLVGALAAFAGAKAQSGEHRIYSNVEYNEEGGDLLGTELDLTINDGRVDGFLKIYQGGCAVPVHFTGSLSGNKVHVSGQGDAHGKIEITGIAKGGRFDGLLHLEKAGTPEKIRLKKIEKPHC